VYNLIILACYTFHIFNVWIYVSVLTNNILIFKSYLISRPNTIETLNIPIKRRYICVVPYQMYMYSHTIAVAYLTEACSGEGSHRGEVCVTATPTSI
jgi:hypothetical protein